MDDPLRLQRAAVNEEVRVRVTGEKQGLEEEHARVPDGRAAAELGQDQFGHHGLHTEEQHRAGEQRDGPPPNRTVRPGGNGTLANRLGQDAALGVHGEGGSTGSSKSGLCRPEMKVAHETKIKG